MKKIEKISGAIIILFLGFYLFSTPMIIFAAGPQDFFQGGSAQAQPSGAGATINVASTPKPPKVNLTYPWSGLRDPSALVSQLFRIALGVAGASALGVLIYGAVLWTVSGAISSKQDAMEWIQGAIWGLVLLLGSYLILFTINPDLVKLKTKEELMGSVNVGILSSFKINYPPATELADATARGELAEAGIRGKSVCPTGTYQGCVNYNGIQQKVLNQVAWLASIPEIGASRVYITGGTEGCKPDGTSAVHAAGPAGHCGGNKVDLAVNAKLDTYVKNNFKQIETRSDGARQYVAPDGSVYALEGNHWDITVK